ncbi:MAG TPA: hypothetical protein VKR61_08090 [Bryobacteraceae bacterium]|nr:hypothetical protein [Bryobacteraceae bacterium]
MNTLVIILIVVVAVLAAGVVWLAISRQKSKHLRARFGPEYQRTVAEMGAAGKAERDLARREKRVERLKIRPLPPATRDRLAEAWRKEQSRFLDDPQGAVLEADRLVMETMNLRGYPVADFEQRADDLSVDHAQVVQNYRAAHDIVARHKVGQADTEDLRQAFVHYRALFDELLEMQEVRS